MPTIQNETATAQYKLSLLVAENGVSDGAESNFMNAMEEGNLGGSWGTLSQQAARSVLLEHGVDASEVTAAIASPEAFTAALAARDIALPLPLMSPSIEASDGFDDLEQATFRDWAANPALQEILVEDAPGGVWSGAELQDLSALPNARAGQIFRRDLDPVLGFEVGITALPVNGIPFHAVTDGSGTLLGYAYRSNPQVFANTEGFLSGDIFVPVDRVADFNDNVEWANEVALREVNSVGRILGGLDVVGNGVRSLANALPWNDDQAMVDPVARQVDRGAGRVWQLIHDSDFGVD